MLAQVALALYAASAASASAIYPRQQSGSGGSTLSSPGAIGFANPPIRGWTQETSTVVPCGGYSLGGRTDFPLTGGQIALVQARDGHNIEITYSTNPDPQSASDFTALLPNITHLYGGSACLQTPDFTTLGLNEGSTVTLRLSYQAGPQRMNFQQCSDLTLVPRTEYIAANDVTCQNVTRSTQTRGGGNTALPSVASSGSSSSSSSSGLSLAEAGGIGAGVTLAVAAAVMAMLFFAGFVTFGKRSSRKNENQTGTTVWRDETRQKDDASTLATGSLHEKIAA